MWSGFAWLRIEPLPAVVDTTMSLRFQKNSLNLLTTCVSVSFSKKAVFHGDEVLKK
jgi:hypothetical protein